MSEQPSKASMANMATSVGPMLEFEKPLIKMEQEIQRLEASQSESGRDYRTEIDAIRKQLRAALDKAYGNLSAWETVLVARHPRRPLFRDYVQLITKDFCELHGDKLHGDDRALITGFARIAGQRVMLMGHHKGRDTREKIEANFGCAHPEGYRKALQKMKLAEKFGVPIVCLVDTPGAYPGVGAEERGIANAIAVNLMEMSRLRTPVIAAVIGEGGSGGALGIAVADRVAVMQYAYYSVISPEGCAAILWKSGEHAPAGRRFVEPDQPAPGGPEPDRSCDRGAAWRRASRSAGRGGRSGAVDRAVLARSGAIDARTTTEAPHRPLAGYRRFRANQ